jgi:polysaccharide export outer membrane protein
MHWQAKFAGISTVGVWICFGAVIPLALAGIQIPGFPNNPAVGRHLPQYVLGPNDEITIMSVLAPEVANKPVRISTSGDINLPMVGRVHAAGSSVEQLETEIIERLKTYFKEPDIAINVTQLKNQPISVLGAVGSPGVIQLEGVKTLVEVLSMVGGLKPDAGSLVKITRRTDWGPIPLPSVQVEGEYSTAEVDIRSIENGTKPEQNIQILPYDMINIPRTELVYVIGAGIKQPGGFALNNRRDISLIEALARAHGTIPGASVKNAKLIRPVPGAKRVEIAVNLKDVLAGKSEDVLLQADDILYVPLNELKGTARKSIDGIVNMAIGAAVYHGLYY